MPDVNTPVSYLLEHHTVSPTLVMSREMGHYQSPGLSARGFRGVAALARSFNGDAHLAYAVAREHDYSSGDSCG